MTPHSLLHPPPADGPDLLASPVWFALTTAQQELALAHGNARRYPANVAPFAAVAPATAEAPAHEALADLAALFAPGEQLFLFGERPAAQKPFAHEGVVPCFQMVFPEGKALPPPPSPSLHIEPLGCGDAAEMLALITVAYPGYFRPATCRMGRYWGIRDPDNNLIAMGGERLVLGLPNRPRLFEISGLCHHPAHAGKGLGTALLTHILAHHRSLGGASWLLVTEQNRRAAALYRRLGFETLRAIQLHRLRRVPS